MGKDCESMLEIIDTTTVIQSWGYLGLFLMLFAETGLLIGILLPGETLLFTAGLLSSAGFLEIWIVVPLAFAAGVLGDSLAYAVGKRFGYDVFSKYPKLGLDAERIARIQTYYETNGRQTLILARFIPFFRTIVPVLAGIGNMKYRNFLIYNLIGAAAWALAVSLIGYFLGELVPNGDTYMPWIISGIMILSVLPLLATLIRRKR